MAGEVTDKDVQKSRERVDRLNEQLAEARAAASAGARTGENEFRKVQLDAEGDRLQAELDQLKTLTQPKVQKAETAIAAEAAAEGILGSSTAPVER